MFIIVLWENLRMASSTRLLTSVSLDTQARFARLAAARGVSKSRLLGLLVHAVLAKNETAAPAASESTREGTAALRTPAIKYTIRLQGYDAAALERRADGRGMPASSYAAQVVRAHLRANPPVPYEEFQQFKRVANELGGIRAALHQLVGEGGAAVDVDGRLSQAVHKLLPVLKTIKADLQATLAANAKSWEVPDA